MTVYGVSRSLAHMAGLFLPSPTRRFFQATLTFAFLAACTGRVGDNGGIPDNPGTPSGSDPGRVTLHRLNRAEYDNTVRDLMGTGLRPGVDFPADDHDYGFDNMADTL